MFPSLQISIIFRITRFLTKVIVSKGTVAFVVYNGAKITRAYEIGPSGNKHSWNKRKEDA